MILRSTGSLHNRGTEFLNVSEHQQSSERVPWVRGGEGWLTNATSLPSNIRRIGALIGDYCSSYKG